MTGGRLRVVCLNAGFEFCVCNGLISPPISCAHLVAVVIRSPSIVFPYVPAHFIPHVLYLVHVRSMARHVYLFPGFRVSI
jgi:hypothetical protein